MRFVSNRASSHGARWAWACAAICVAGCGGGGGGGTSAPATSFAFVQAAGTATEGAAALDVHVVLHTTLAALATSASIDVIDVGGGTATSGADYTSFAPHTVTFPAGAVDGDVQAVSFAALNDLLVEGASETARLGLQNAVGGSAYGTTQFTATITDIHQATIQFGVASSTTPDESAVPRNVAVVLHLPPGVTLGVAATVHIADAGGGSATSGVDYTAFAPATVTFPIGSADGAAQTIALQVIDDSSIETDETVRLSLSTPATGTAIGATSLHQLTIHDDDAAAAAAFIATAGSTGVESTLADNQQISLGSQTVGAGANAGTLVRVTNAGGSALTLDAPYVSGTDANDFAVEIEVAPTVSVAATSMVGPDIASPLVERLQTTGPGVGLSLNTEQLAALATLPRATLTHFPVPGAGDVVLDLQRMPLPITDDAVLRVDGADVPGGLRAAVGDLSLWSGSVQGLPGSHAFLALSSAGSRGFVALGSTSDQLVHLVPDSTSTAPGASRIVRDEDVAALGFVQPPEACSEERAIPGQESLLAPSSMTASALSSSSMTVANCRLAIETDYQLFQKFGSSGATTTYVTQLIAAISDRYFTDIQTTLSIAYLGVYTTAGDPWTSQDSGGNSSNLLDEFRAAWAPNNWPVSANLAHFISGANLGGGVAYVGALCNATYGFGVSGNINGNVNWGTWNESPGNFTWDFVVVAHEIGHNFGSSHTHSYCPPLDQCYANCNSATVCTRGTIMSYCHLCGGMANIDLVFHPVCANIMRNSVNASCLGASALAASSYVQYLVRFNPLTATGSRNATLTFIHDATNAPQPFRVRLTGTAQ